MDATNWSTIITGALIAAGVALSRWSAQGRTIHRRYASAQAAIESLTGYVHALKLLLTGAGIEPPPEPDAITQYRKSLEE